eukprot:1149671-Pelagomonas_calceolata.AAC.10
MQAHEPLGWLLLRDSAYPFHITLTIKVTGIAALDVHALARWQLVIPKTEVEHILLKREALLSLSFPSLLLRHRGIRSHTPTPLLVGGGGQSRRDKPTFQQSSGGSLPHPSSPMDV